MTPSTATFLVRAPRRALRADRLVAALLVAAAAGIAALALAPAPRPPARPAGARAALVVDAGGAPRAALDRARAAARSGVAVRVPRSGAEAAADVRYFAAQGYGSVVAVGPLARGAVRAAAPAYPRTRFVGQ
jgi:basic membrane lipoprotein Med (substrate-binding protein (PBP1-ABC) superfamily)